MSKADTRQYPKDLEWSIIDKLVFGGSEFLGLSACEFAILIKIVGFSLDKKKTFPSEESIALKSGVNARAVARAKVSLKLKAGLSWSLIRRNRSFVCEYDLHGVYDQLREYSSPTRPVVVNVSPTLPVVVNEDTPAETVSINVKCNNFHHDTVAKDTNIEETNIEEEEKEKDLSPTAPGDKSPVSAFVALWNEVTEGILPAVREITKGRTAKIKRRLKEHPELEWWSDVFRALIQDDFYSGRKPGNKWRATIDWIIRNDQNALQFIEGQDGTQIGDAECDRQGCAACSGDGIWRGKPCPKCNGQGYQVRRDGKWCAPVRAA